MTWFECEQPTSKEIKKQAFKLNKYDKVVLHEEIFVVLEIVGK